MPVSFFTTEDITSENIQEFWSILGAMDVDIIPDDLDIKLRDILQELIWTLEEKGL